MSTSEPGKFIFIESPAREVAAYLADVIKGHTTPTLTYISDKLMPGCNTYMEYGWIWEMPQPNPHIFEHVHDYDEFLFHMGSDHMHPEYLGAEIEFVIDGKTILINKTSTLFIPRGVKHGPVVWKRVDRPHIQMAIFPTQGDMKKTGVGGYSV